MKHRDSISIEKMVVHGIVGAKPRERIKPQALVVSITLHTDFTCVANTDNLQDAEIDYACVLLFFSSFEIDYSPSFG